MNTVREKYKPGEGRYFLLDGTQDDPANPGMKVMPRGRRWMRRGGTADGTPWPDKYEPDDPFFLRAYCGGEDDPSVPDDEVVQPPPPEPVLTVRYFPINEIGPCTGDDGLEAPPLPPYWERTFRDGRLSGQSAHMGYEDAAERARQATFAREAATSEQNVVRALVEAHDGTLRFCPASGGWLRWDGHFWRRGASHALPWLIQEVAHAAAQAQDAAVPREKLGPRFVEAVERCARAEPAFAAGQGWDEAPLLLGTPEGTLDLETGTLRAAVPGDFITRATAVAPAATAECPRWRQFIKETTCGDAALERFLQKFFGYGLTGDASEQVLLFGHGEGGNGKTVLVNTVAGLLGDYAVTAPLDLLAGHARGGGGSLRELRATAGDLARLAGARLVAASENEEGRVWAEARLKLMTGGDPITARTPGGDPFNYRPGFKLMIVGNHVPGLATVDAAIRRRFRLVPFRHVPAEPDRKLESKLKEEWPGILRWMVEGCSAWQAEGLSTPEAVREASDAYLGGQDLVRQFLDEACETTDAGATETASALYAAWTAYARAAGETPGAQRRFSTALERHGFLRARTRHARMYQGLRLRKEEGAETAA